MTSDSLPAESKPAISAPLDSGPAKWVSPSINEPYRELIYGALARGRNANAIWQDLVDDYGFAGSYQNGKRFARRQARPVTDEAGPAS